MDLGISPELSQIGWQNITSAMPSRRKRRPKPSPSPASASCRPANHRGQGISPELVAPSCFVLLARPTFNPHPPSPPWPPHPPRPWSAPPAILRMLPERERARARDASLHNARPSTAPPTHRPTAAPALRCTPHRAAKTRPRSGPHRPPPPTAAPRPRTVTTHRPLPKRRRAAVCRVAHRPSPRPATPPDAPE
nr:vegetative cell wall protein gp1-like [Lolium perenne]